MTYCTHTKQRLVDIHTICRDSLQVRTLDKQLHAGGLKECHPMYDETVELQLVLEVSSAPTYCVAPAATTCVGMGDAWDGSMA